MTSNRGILPITLSCLLTLATSASADFVASQSLVEVSETLFCRHIRPDGLILPCVEPFAWTEAPHSTHAADVHPLVPPRHRRPARAEAVQVTTRVSPLLIAALVAAGCASAGGTAGIFDVGSVWYRHPATGDVMECGGGFYPGVQIRRQACGKALIGVGYQEVEKCKVAAVGAPCVTDEEIARAEAGGKR